MSAKMSSFPVRLPNIVSAFTSHIDSFHMLQWRMKHLPKWQTPGKGVELAPENCDSTRCIPMLHRSYSTGGLSSELYDPGWHHEKRILINIMEKFDISKEQLRQAAKSFAARKPFADVLTYISNMTERERKLCSKNHSAYAIWLKTGVEPKKKPVLVRFNEKIARFIQSTKQKKHGW